MNVNRLGDNHQSLVNKDIQAAVASGLLSDMQGAKLVTFVAARRAAVSELDDEPFVLFQGFSEVFISIGLILLLAGLAAVGSNFDLGWLAFYFIGVTCWVFSLFFVGRRRLVLPGIVLVLWLAIGVFVGTVGVQDHFQENWEKTSIAFLFSFSAVCVWYFVFKLPFSLFVAGGCALLFLISIVSDLEDTLFDPTLLVDFVRSPAVAAVTLGFGLVTMLLAIRFDLRDPYRVGRSSSCAFWLHLLAAPAIVNCIAFTAWNSNTAYSVVLTVIALSAVTVFALLLDRRSFLTAGAVYAWAILVKVFSDSEWAVALTGAGIVILGVYWVPIRARLFSVLPEWRFLTKLPPARIKSSET